MGIKFIQESTLTDIADALRTALGTTNKLDPADYASYIGLLKISERGKCLQQIQTCIANGNLDSLTWSQIQNLRFALTNNYIDFSELEQLIGLSKSFIYNNKTCYAVLIHVSSCWNEWNSTSPALTFWCVETRTPLSTTAKGLGIAYSYFGGIYSNKGGWGGTERQDVLRTALQPGGTIYDNMPEDIRNVIMKKRTYYGPTYNSTDENEVEYVVDSMFLPSAKEVYNINTPAPIMSSVATTIEPYDYPFWQYEGAGVHHNEQFKYFKQAGITYSTNYNKLKNIENYGVWLRTAGIEQGTSFCNIARTGEISSDSNKLAVCPCFCV